MLGSILIIFLIIYFWEKASFPVKGLYINLFVFAGIGPLIWSWNHYYYNNEVYIYDGSIYFFIVSFLLIYLTSRLKIESDFTINNLNIIYFLLLPLSFISCISTIYINTFFEVSGFLTIIVILKYFFFPSVALLIYNSKSGLLIAYALLLLLLIYIYSDWRSTIFFIVITLFIGFSNRKINNLSKAFILLSLPFGLVISFFQNTQSRFYSSLIYVVDSIEILTYSIGIRLNSLRENKYAFDYLDGFGKQLDGYSYIESFQQIIPSFIIPNEYDAGYYLSKVISKDIGLVNILDDGTSWGINFISEFFINFGFSFFSTFLCVLFLTFFIAYPLKFFNNKFSKISKFLFQIFMFFTLLEFVLFTTYLSAIFYSIILIFLINFYERFFIRRN